MKRRTVFRLGLIGVMVFLILCATVAYRLPDLIRVSLELGIPVSWEAVHEYLERDLIGLSMSDVHSKLKELDPNVEIGEISFRIGRPCENIRMFQGGLPYFNYRFCYSDSPGNRRLISAKLSS